ncbi:hypothetical protein CCR97_01485 [Rhodoplanes elegans]|uniref:Uncharacterized protein n=1 Tax=Rhodoplanes elegans TaxID=29408 RepID=A0A327KH64_9BRAD|nr:hypothetical protein [Rhodoplanes elegans]MBK5956891.1 hypothetical protein [Rhodoplanes elegans]RAI38069.1 hypothetical protein CH338_13920 [Rhodoplanes elegans]
MGERDAGDTRFAACRREQQAKAEALDRLRADVDDAARLHGMSPDKPTGRHVLRCPCCGGRLDLWVDLGKPLFQGGNQCPDLRRIRDLIRDQLAGRGHGAVEVR